MDKEAGEAGRDARPAPVPLWIDELAPGYPDPDTREAPAPEFSNTSR